MLFAAHGYHLGEKKSRDPPQFSKMHNCFLRHMPALSGKCKLLCLFYIFSSDRVSSRQGPWYIRHVRRAR